MGGRKKGDLKVDTGRMIPLSGIACTFLILVIVSDGYSMGFNNAPEGLYFPFDSIVEVASRSQEAVSDVPATVVVVTREEILRRGYRDLVDLLKDLPGIDIQERIGGQDGGAYVIPRGIWGNNKVQILMDGLPLNPLNGTHVVFGHHFSLWGLKQVEVLYGPASSIYGPDAFSSVINLVTQDAPPTHDPHSQKAEGAFWAGRNDAFESHALFARRFSEDASVAFYAHGFRTDGFNMRDEYKNTRIDNGFGTKTPIYEPNAPYRTPTQDWDMYFKGKISDWHLRAQYLGTRQPNNIQTIYYTGRSQLEKDKVELRTLNIALEHTKDLDKGFSLTSTLNYQYYLMEPDSDYGRHTFDNYIYERSKAGEWREQVEWRPWDWGKYILGFSLRGVSTFPYINSRERFHGGDVFSDFPVRSVKLQDGTIRDVPWIRKQRYWAYGVYGQWQKTFFTDLKAVVGARYDWDTFNHEESFNPRIGLIYDLSQGQELKFQFGTAFISPSAYFKFKEWLGERYVHLPPGVLDKDLDPERLKSFDVSYHVHRQRFDLTCSSYYSIAKDIIQEAGGRLYGNTLYLNNGQAIEDAVIEFPENSGTQRTFGIDVYGRIRLNQDLQLRAWYSFLNARVDLDHLTFDAAKVSTHKVGIGLTYSPIDSLTMDVRARWWSGIHTLPDNPLYRGGKIKGKALLDAHMEWKTPLKGLSLEMTGKNLLNIDYFTAGAEREDHKFGASLPLIPQRPREVYVGFYYRF